MDKVAFSLFGLFVWILMLNMPYRFNLFLQAFIKVILSIIVRTMQNITFTTVQFYTFVYKVQARTIFLKLRYCTGVLELCSQEDVMTKTSVSQPLPHKLHICRSSESPEKAIYWFSILASLPMPSFLDKWGQFSYGLSDVVSFMSRKGHKAIIKTKTLRLCLSSSLA